MLEQYIVALVLIGNVPQIDLGEKLRVVDTFLNTEIAQCNEERLRRLSIHTCLRTLHNRRKLVRFGSGLLHDVALERTILKWRNLSDAPKNDDCGENEFPKNVT